MSQPTIYPNVLAYVELQTTVLHGNKFNTGNWLLIYEYSNTEFMQYYDDISFSLETYTLDYFNQNIPYIKNLLTSQTHSRHHTSLDIVSYYYGDDDECFAILKTFWLRILQKKWKNIYAIRKNKMRIRKQYNSYFMKTISGVYPKGCKYIR